MLKALVPAATILLATLSSAEPASAQARGRVALVVGNGAYSSVGALYSPPKDAQLMAETLRTLGFTLSGGGYHTDVSRDRLARLLSEFGREARNADAVVFYYSGHGAQILGTNYLFPSDANPTGPADYPLQMLNAEHVLQQMDASQARLKFLILDACRNNPFVRQQLKQAANGLAQMRAPEGTVIVFATQPDSVARDGGPSAPSIYTAHLVPVMRKPGLDLFTMFNDAAIATMDATDKLQQPWLTASPIRGIFQFNRLVAASTSPAPPATSPVISDGASLSYIQTAHRQLDVRDYIGAQATLTQAIRSDPNAALPYSYRGYMWSMQGNDLAKEAEKLALNDKKRDAIRQALQKYKLAFDDFDKAIALDPSYQPARRHRGNAIVAVYRARRSVGMEVNDILDKAIADLKIAAELDIKSPAAAISLGDAYLLKGRYQEAITHFDRAININPKYAAAYHGRCQAWLKLNDWARARADADAAAARDDAWAGRTCLQS